MSATPVTSIPNRPSGKPVFDFAIAAGYCRVPLTTVSNDGQTLVVSGWALLIDAQGVPVLDTHTAVPVSGTDGTNSIALSGVMIGTHCLYDAWCRYMPQGGETISAANLPAGWTSGSGAPTGTPAYGTGYYDTAADQAWIYTQGELARIAAGYANALQAQIDTAAKLATLGL